MRFTSRHGFTICCSIAAAALLCGCATIPAGRPASLGESAAPAWSLRHESDELIVSVSPAGQSLRMAGSAGLVIGTSVDAVVNARYRRKLAELLDNYDTAGAIDEALAERLKAALGDAPARVAPLTSTAGFNTKRDADAARFSGVARAGSDTLLDLSATHGLYGPQGALIIKMDGRLVLVPEGKRLWSESIIVDTEPIFANDKLGDPTNRLTPYIGMPRLAVDSDALGKWEEPGALRRAFETAVDAAVSALVCELGLAEEAVGEYHLGKLALNRKDFDRAATRFERALKLDPAFYDARNGLAVVAARHKRIDDAVALARSLTETAPDYGPAWFNLAWWLIVEKDDVAAGRSCYERALELGMPGADRIERRIAGTAAESVASEG